MPDIIIAVPAFRGTIKAKCTTSLIGLVAELIRREIGFEFKTVDIADVVVMRNLFGSHLLAKRSATHLLFVDDDIAFNPLVVTRMVDTDHAVIGCACRLRTEKIVFNIRPGKDTPDIQNGMCRVAAIGMGLTLISREAVEKLAATGKLRMQANNTHSIPAPGAPVYGFFDHASTKDGQLTEDFSFCGRWSNLCNGEIWAIIDEAISHIGDCDYSGKFIDHLKAPQST